MPVAKKSSSSTLAGSFKEISNESGNKKRSRRGSLKDDNVLFKTGADKESTKSHGKLLNVQAEEKKDAKEKVGVKKSGINSTSKLAGSLFTPVLFNEPRRRNTFSMPEKPQVKSTEKVVVEKKISKPKDQVEPNEEETQKTTKSEKKKTIRSTERIILANINQSPVKKVEPVNMMSPEKKTATPKSAMKAPPKFFVPVSVKTPKKTTSFKEPESNINGSNDKLNERLQELQSQFEKLSMLRTTAAEQLLEDYKKNSEARFAASQNLISSLRAENALLKERVSSLTSKSSRESNVSMLSMMSTNTTAASSNLIYLYKNLSGLSIEPVDENKWNCSIEGRQGDYEFSLEFDSDEAEYTYTPKFMEDCAVWERLPAYLKEEIVFGQNHLQAFFWRALNFLMTQ